MTRHLTIVSALSAALALTLAGCSAGTPEAADADGSAPVQSTSAAEDSAPAVASSAPVDEPSATASSPAVDMAGDDLAQNGVSEGMGIVIAEPSDGEDGGGARVQVLDTETMTGEILGQFGVGLPLFENVFSDYPVETRGQFNPEFTRMAGFSEGSFGWYTPFDEFVDVGAQMQQDSDEFQRGSVYSGGYYDGEGNYYFSKSPAPDGGTKEKIEEIFMIPAGGDPAEAKSLGLPAGEVGVNFEVDEHGRVSLCDPLCSRWRANAGGEEGGVVADWISDTEFVTLNADRTMIYRDTVAPDETGFGSTGTQVPILPETEREVYSPVVSPDGKQVAFLSPSKETPGWQELFIGPIDGSSAPKKVEATNLALTEGAKLADWL